MPPGSITLPSPPSGGRAGDKGLRRQLKEGKMSYAALLNGQLKEPGMKLGIDDFGIGKRCIGLRRQQQARGIFQDILHRLEKTHRFTTVDDAVIVGQGHVHHGPDDHRSIFGNRPVLDIV